MAAPSVEAVVTLKSGERHTFRQDAGNIEGKNHYQKLRESLKKVQEEVNACLTQQVEQEKATNQVGGGGDSKRGTESEKKDVDSDEGDEDDDENMNEEKQKSTSKRTTDKLNETASKKQKT
ncbi:uncharacterized protein [Amphiura filiformis]|uniref:uncharacterized protein n=1 Tax=Amphiura filiformis TaxID=82378 RepID=UPI003B21376B